MSWHFAAQLTICNTLSQHTAAELTKCSWADIVRLKDGSGADMIAVCTITFVQETWWWNHDGNDMSCTLRRHIDLVAWIAKQIVKVILYKLQDQYCHKLERREVERQTSICLMQCRVIDYKKRPYVVLKSIAMLYSASITNIAALLLAGSTHQ